MGGSDGAPRPSRRNVAVVANGAAGALLADPAAEAMLAEQCAGFGLIAHFVPADAGSLPERIARARAMQADAVVVAGGDGTVACAAACLLGSTVPLGILPFGTMNLLAKDLRLPIGDTAAALEILAHGVLRDIDVGQVGEHVFLCASMLGLPARLARHREAGRGQSRWRHWTRFAVAGVRMLRRGRRQVFVLRGEAGKRLVSTPSVTVTVNALATSPGHAFGRDRLDGGELAVYVVETLRLSDLPRLGWRALRGRLAADATVRESRTRRLVVGSSAATVRVMNDGEVRLMRPPLRYRVRPGALRVIVPADPA